MEWNGVGMEWKWSGNGVEWSGMEWNRMEIEWESGNRVEASQNPTN